MKILICQSRFLCYDIHMTHTFYAVSTGPAGSRYLTQESIATLKKCNTIFYPFTKGSSKPHIAFDCIKQIDGLSVKNCIGVGFSMSGKKDQTDEEYKNITEQITDELKKGDVAFIAIGDVSIYSSAARMANIIERNGFNTEFVSGVTSFCAAACALKLDLVQEDTEIRIIPGDAYIKKGKFDAVLESEGTKIIMKSARHAKEIVRKIEERNLLEYSYFVHNVGYADERIFRKNELKNIPEEIYQHAYMSIIILTNHLTS